MSDSRCPNCRAKEGEYHREWCPELDTNKFEDFSFPKKAVRKEVLEKAEDAVLRDRQSTYGDLEDSFSHTAKLWSIHLGIEVNPVDVPILLALLKVARLKSSPEHLDNWVDIAGYAACGGEIATREK